MGINLKKIKIYITVIIIFLFLSVEKLNSNCSSCKKSCITRSIFIPRSQGSNIERETLGLDEKVHTVETCNNNIFGSFTFQYERSFNSKSIAKNLFNSESLKFVGSQVASRQNTGNAACCDLVADYFGLSTLSQATLTLKPVIQNFIWDIEFFFELDSYHPGLYFRINAPVTYTSWDLLGNNCQTCNILSSTTLDSTPFPASYMSTTTLSPNTNIIDALSGVTSFTDGWAFGKFKTCRQEKLGLADLDIILGYDFFKTDCSHFGIYGQLVGLTNKQPNPEFVFSPVIGNHNWKLGAGMSAHHKIFEDSCQTWAVYFEANLLNFLKKTQLRSFDFCAGECNNNNLSRYMLLKEFNTDGTYAGNIISAINFTTRKVDISVKLECDANLKFSCFRNNWTFDVGYGFYGRTKEDGCLINSSCCQSCPDSCNTNFDGRIFGFKGTDGVACLTYNIEVSGDVRTITGPANQSQSLNATQSNATLCNVLGAQDTDNPVPNETTPLPTSGSASVCLNWNSTNGTGLTYTDNSGNVNPSGIVVAQSSLVPVTFTNLDTNLLNKESGLSCSQLTHKFFVHVIHKWESCCFNPFLAIGGNIEFAQNNNNCGSCGLTKWSLLLKTGINF